MQLSVNDNANFNTKDEPWTKGRGEDQGKNKMNNVTWENYEYLVLVVDLLISVVNLLLLLLLQEIFNFFYSSLLFSVPGKCPA